MLLSNYLYLLILYIIIGIAKYCILSKSLYDMKDNPLYLYIHLIFH